MTPHTTLKPTSIWVQIKDVTPHVWASCELRGRLETASMINKHCYNSTRMHWLIDWHYRVCQWICTKKIISNHIYVLVLSSLNFPLSGTMETSWLPCKSPQCSSCRLLHQSRTIGVPWRFFISNMVGLFVEETGSLLHQSSVCHQLRILQMGSNCGAYGNQNYPWPMLHVAYMWWLSHWGRYSINQLGRWQYDWNGTTFAYWNCSSVLFTHWTIWKVLCSPGDWWWPRNSEASISTPSSVVSKHFVWFSLFWTTF